MEVSVVIYINHINIYAFECYARCMTMHRCLEAVMRGCDDAQGVSEMVVWRQNGVVSPVPEVVV